MGYGRWVLTARVTVPAGTPSAVAQPGGTVSYSNGSGTTSKWAPPFPVTFERGQVIFADDTAPGTTPTGPQQLYQAIIAVSATALTPFRDGTDTVSHQAISN
jgi:hypothetical protein